MSQFAVGLTGGIGSGKSTVSGLFEAEGVPVIDADLIARDITRTSQPAFTAITEHFGQGILRPDGQLDRKTLRSLIFTNPKDRQWLEGLLHPLIRDEIVKRISMVTSPYCIVVIPLLFETNAYPFLNRVLVVDATFDAQKARVMARDHLNEAEFNRIYQTQISREQRLGLADEVIKNDGHPEDLLIEVKRLHQLYTKMAAVHFQNKV